MIDFVVLAAALLSTASLASPTADRNARDTDGCAQMNQWSKANPNKDVPPTLAYGCLKAVPVDVDGDAQLVSEMSNIVRWQSTIAYLKNPPQGYPAPPLDLLGGLNDIKNKISSNGYQSEYDVQMDIVNLFNLAYDGHLGYTPDIATTIGFGRVPEDSNLVSVSSDGKSPPKVYLKTDIDKQHNDGSFIPSAIQSINNQPVSDYLKWLSDTDGSSPDPDTRYQNLFYNPAGASQSQNNGTYFTASGIYEADSITLTHEDKTATQLQNVANIQVDLSNINSGSTFFNTFLTGKQSSSSSKPRSSSSKPHPPYGYPAPVWYTSDNTLAGYFLTDANYKDVAVISNPDFQPNDDDEFRNTVSSFLADAVTAKKTHLIIDLRHNSGGSVELGYDLFKQLFPAIDAFAAADRARATEALDLLGEKFSDIAAGVPRTLEGVETNETLYELEADVVSSYLNFRTDTKPDGTAFESWADKFGPVPSAKGDEYTDLSRWNLSDVLTPFNSGDIWVTGYGEGVKNATQPFKAEDIVVMTDGYCASTCTIFSRLMQDLAGVKYVAMGGRSPSTTSSAPITQAIGGVKGTNNWPWDYIQYNVGLAYSYANTTEQDYFDTTSLADYNDQLPFLRAAAGTAYNVNFRDGIKKDDFEARTPTQFVYEPADCRVYWTKEMTVDVTAAWKAVADSAWGYGESKCVAGGLGAPQGNATYGAERRTRRSSSSLSQVRKRELVESDYPLDLWTDLDGLDLRMDGYMMP